MEKGQQYISIFHEKRPRLPRGDILASLAEFAARENVRLYIVGGTVRDLILGREIGDLDFSVADDAFGFVRGFADFAGGKFVPLDEEHDTARVVLDDGKIYMDFSGIRGANIAEDLTTRDFTINAMAMDFSKAMSMYEAEVIDPYSGAEDLNKRLIRLVSAQSIRSDPIRMVRAYRFAAILGFTIHDATSAIIRDSVSLLDSVSAERIRDELFKILAVGNSAYYLKGMGDAGLLERVFPEIAPMKGMEQNEYHHLDVWEHSMLTLEFFEADPLPDSLKGYITEIEEYLEYEPVKGRSRHSLLKLAALLHDVGKPATRTIDMSGRIRFFEHNVEGAEIIMNVGRRLKLATREILSLGEIVKYHMYLLGLNVFLRQPRSAKEKTRAMRRFIQKTGFEWLAVLLISFADLRATQGPWRRADDQERTAELIGEFADLYFQDARSRVPKLVTGDDLMEQFNLPPSPIIGDLLERVKEAQMDGEVKTRDEAMELIRKFLKLLEKA